MRDSYDYSVRGDVGSNDVKSLCLWNYLDSSLLVNKLVDIKTEPMPGKLSMSKWGLHGSAVTDNRITWERSYLQ